ncbi:MAG: tetratricopeptide repeat protein [Deinococcota bacterium]|nr:tetratricopeptide repeat protein [Deinococcota bacterium]
MENLTPLLSRLKPVVTKRAGLALGLWGEAGIGKTFAAQRLLAAATCRSFSVHATVPLAELLKALPRPPRLPLWAQRSVERLERGEHVEPLSSADALSALLAALAPVALHLEDLHEATAERQGLWQLLAERVKRSRGVALLATSRSLPPEPFEAWRVEPLSEASSASLLAVKLGTKLPAEASAWIYKRAQGNPLFTLEFLRYLTRQGYLWNDLRYWRWREPPTGFVPVTVEALIEHLLEAGMTQDAKEALEAAAMLPVDAPPGLWPKVAGLPEDHLTAARLELERCGFFKGEGFVHPLFREVTLHTLSPARRRELSRRALAALEDDPQKAALFVEDAGLEAGEARALLEQAVQQAKDAGNALLAARFQAQAALYARDESQGKLALEAAEVLQHHDLSEAVRLLSLALTTPAATAETVRLYAHLLARQGRLPETKVLLEGLPLQLQEQVQPASLFVTTHNIAGNHQTALQIWEAHPELHAQPSSELLRAVAASALATGRTQEAQALTARGLEGTLPPSLRSEFLSIQALIFFHQSNYLAAETKIREVLALLAGMNAPRLRSTALLNQAAFLRMLGDYAAMGACLEASLQIRQQAGDAKGYAFAQAALAELRLEQGHYDQAEDLLLQAIATLELYGPSRFLINAHAMASALYTAQASSLGNLLALKHSEQALAYARETNNPRMVREILFDASLANTRSGDARRGLSLAEESQALAGAAGNSPNDNFRTLWALALAEEALGNPQEATLHLREALNVAQATDVAIDVQKIALELDRLKGDVDSARERLAWFEERGLMNGVNIAKRYFPELAGAVVPAPVPDGLPRLEVLGPMQVVHDGKAEPVRGHKRKELLARLLEAKIAGRAEVSQLDLFDGLYPGEPEEAAADSLKQLVFQLRKSLGVGTILRTTGGYALGNVTSDAEDFLRAGDTRLWRDVYREDAGEGDETVASALYHALRMKAADLLKADPLEAARLGRLLLQADPYDVESLRLTIKALQAAGNYQALTRLYGQGCRHLAEVGERLPGHWADFLAQAAA